MQFRNSAKVINCKLVPFQLVSVYDFKCYFLYKKINHCNNPLSFAENKSCLLLDYSNLLCDFQVCFVTIQGCGL